MHALAAAALPLFVWVVCADCAWLGALARARAGNAPLRCARALAHRATCAGLLALHVCAALLVQAGVAPGLPVTPEAVRQLALAAACSGVQGAALQTLAALLVFDERAIPRALRAAALLAALAASAAGMAALCLLDMRVRGGPALRAAVALHAALFVGAALHAEALCARRAGRAPVTRAWR